MPVVVTGPCCERPGCRWPHYHDGLCLRCYRLARTVGRDPAALAKEPRLDGDLRALTADLAERDRRDGLDR